jgi:cyclophilin family peptidyl-prolyl cis-trans isomerase
MRKKLIDKKAYKHLHKFCFFCGEDEYAALHCHRIIPGEEGGTYHAHNTLTVCASCHAKIHSGRINIDRKYPQTRPVFKVHYWLDGEEVWRDEEIGMFTTGDYHSRLGRSAKVLGKRRRAQGTADSGQDRPEDPNGTVCGNSPTEAKLPCIDTES